MASRDARDTGERDAHAGLKTRTAASAAARRADYARIKAALAQITELIARRDALVRKTSTAAPAPEAEADVVRQLADAVEAVRDLVLTSETRLQALENELLELLHAAAYRGHATGAGVREPTLHVPAAASADMARLAEETGVAALAPHAAAMTRTFACPL